MATSRYHHVTEYEIYTKLDQSGYSGGFQYRSSHVIAWLFQLDLEKEKRLITELKPLVEEVIDGRKRCLELYEKDSKDFLDHQKFLGQWGRLLQKWS